jgi:hypothetical protein
LKEEVNSNAKTGKVFPTYMFADYDEKDIIFDNWKQEQESFESYEYYSLNDEDTPNFRGGYIFNFSGTQQDINSTYADLVRFIDSSPSWAVIFLELLYYNPKYDMLVKEDIMFVRLSAGYIHPKIETNVTRYFYSTSLDMLRGVLECIFLILAGVYFTRTMRRWYLKGILYMKKIYDKHTPRLKDNNLCMRYFELDIVEVRNMKFRSFIIKISVSLVVTFAKTIYRIIYTLLQHLFSGAFEFFDTLSMTLLIQEFVIWIQIIVASDYIITADGSDGDTRYAMNATVENLVSFSNN